MMALLRVLHAEALKMKRTIALKMVVLAPVIVVLLILFVAAQAPFSTVNRHGAGKQWEDLTTAVLRLWALLMLPLYVTLETALMAGLDHSENHWKSLLARPVPRWTLYAAKLLVIVAMTAASTLVLVGGIVLDGALLPRFQAELVFAMPVPWGTILRDSSQIAGLTFLSLTIQYWVAMRWRSFAVAIGTGSVGMVVGFFAAAVTRQLGGWPQYFPWALPMLVLSRQPHDLGLTLLICAVLGVLTAAAGCVDFCRREVQ